MTLSHGGLGRARLARVHGDSQCIFSGAEGFVTQAGRMLVMTGVALPLGGRKAPTDRRLAGRHWTRPNAARCCVRPREGRLKTQGPGRPQEAAGLRRRQGWRAWSATANNVDNNDNHQQQHHQRQQHEL